MTWGHDCLHLPPLGRGAHGPPRTRGGKETRLAPCHTSASPLALVTESHSQAVEMAGQVALSPFCR